MSTVKVITANNVEIEYEVAGIGDRAIATLIDWLIMFAYFFIVYKIITTTSLQYDLSITVIIMLYLPVFLYHLIFEMFLDGQSIGKKAMGIRVVMLDAGRPAFLNYFLRWIITPLEFGFGGLGVVSLIICAANGRGQRLADIFAGTTVIRLVPKTSITDTIIAPEPDPNYVATFEQVLQLTDREMNLIKMVQKQLRYKSKAEALYFAEKTKDSICKKLEITSELDGLSFINTILKDYQHLATQTA